MKENRDQLFDKFIKGSTCMQTLQAFQALCREVNIVYPPKRTTTYDHVTFYLKLKQALESHWKAKSLFGRLDKKYNDEINFSGRKNSREGQERAAKDMNVLVIGAGPCGLRTAIFTALLGAKTIVVEKRDSFSRNNVLHLWPFTIEDLKSLGAKKFNGRFCSGAIDHVSIRQLQLILMKAALIFGVEIQVNHTFIDLVSPNVEGMTGWKAQFLPKYSPVNNFEFQMVVGADGRKNTLKGFKKKEFRGSLAIGITVNFINKNTSAEARVEEISGINYIYRQEWFKELNMKHNIDLENIVYYKDDTHYFVMTARKQSLLQRGVLLQCLDDHGALVHNNNIDQKALLGYALDAVNFSTKEQLPDLELAINHYGLPDIALFDFTRMKSSVNASMFHEVNGVMLLKTLVGDGLLEPFWPKGTGIAKGFLAAYDTAWMLRQWALGRCQSKCERGTLELALLAERESIYRILAQIETNNLVAKQQDYSIDPKTRYQYLPKTLNPGQVRTFFITDGKEVQTMPIEENTDGPIVPSRLTRNVSFVKSNKLQQWCERVLRESGAQNIVTNMNSSWKDGYALSSIINYYRPDILDLDQLEPENVQHNNQLAFDAAETHLGITPIMSGKEMAECETVDDLVMVTYLSQFYEILKNETPVKPVGRVSDIIATPSEDSLPKLSKKKVSPLGLLTRISMQFKRKSARGRKEYDLDSQDSKKRRMKQDDEVANSDSDVIVLKSAVLPTIPDEDDKENTVVMRRNSITPGVRKSATNRISSLGQQLISQFEQNSDVSIQTPERKRVVKNSNSSVCYFCSKTVYIVERLSVEGLFFHRQCFKCSHCETILRPMNYKRDSDTGKFYCTVHYFANVEYLKNQAGEDIPETSKSLSPVPSIKIETSQPDESDIPSPSGSKSPSFSEHNLSVHTIEHGQVVMRRDLTPKRTDMEEFALAIAQNPIEIGEEQLYEHNMRCSHTDADDDDTTESEDEELEEIARKMTGLDKQSAQELITQYHKSREHSITKTSDSAFLSSESEGDDDVSSLSSTSADETEVASKQMNEVDQVDELNEGHIAETEKDNVSLSTASTAEGSGDEHIVMDDTGLDKDAEQWDIVPDDDVAVDIVLDGKDEVKENELLKNAEHRPVPAKRTNIPLATVNRSFSSSSSEDEVIDHPEVVDSDDAVAPPIHRKDTLESAEEYIRDHPIEKMRRISSSSSSDDGLSLNRKEVDDNNTSTASSDEDAVDGRMDEPKLIGTDFRSPVCKTFNKNDTSIWASNSEDMDIVRSDVDENVQEEQMDSSSAPQKELVFIASTPKVKSFLHSDNEIFETPCGGEKSEFDDSFYSVASGNGSSKDISSYLSPGEMDTTITSERTDSVASDSFFNKFGTGRKLPETPKASGRRRLPIIPHLEALSPTASDVSPEQRRRIEMKLKKHEDKVMERIKMMKIGVRGTSDQSNSSLLNESQKSDETQASERDDFVNHVPVLLQRRSNALRKKKKLKLDIVGSELKKDHKKKKVNHKAPLPVPAKVLSPRHRSSKRREFSSYSREEIDNRVSQRVRWAAQRQAKEAERKRMARAMVIQGQLQEVDAKQKQLEERGVELEILLRGQQNKAAKRPRDSSMHMHEWFKLVQEKNALLRYENELMIYQRELQLEDKQSRLQQDLRERMSIDDSKKSREELIKEREILSEMMSVVEQRDELVALLDEHKMQDKEESTDIQQVLLEKFAGDSPLKLSSL